MRSISFTLTAVFLAASFVYAADDNSKTNERLDDSATLFNEIMAASDKGIPQGLLDKSYCMVLVPGLKKGAFIIGGKYGRGFSICRAAGGQGWGPPAAIRVEGGSFGFQIGGSSTDVVLLIMNEHGMKGLNSSKFTLGGEATVAAGPVGRDTTAQTDASMRAEILSWSRSRGIFAGISLDGATLRNDLDENRNMYGEAWTGKQILGSSAPIPPGAHKLIETLNKYSPRRAG